MQIKKVLLVLLSLLWTQLKPLKWTLTKCLWYCIVLSGTALDTKVLLWLAPWRVSCRLPLQPWGPGPDCRAHRPGGAAGCRGWPAAVSPSPGTLRATNRPWGRWQGERESRGPGPSWGHHPWLWPSLSAHAGGTGSKGREGEKEISLSAYTHIT